MKSLISVTTCILGFLLICFLVFYTTVEYKPKNIDTIDQYIPITNIGDIPLERLKAENIKKSSLTLISWNIGYGGMGKNMDYYFDGGKRVNPNEVEFNTNYRGILSFLAKNPANVTLLQEVDIKSQRSYFNDMATGILNVTGGQGYFSANYKNPYVPFPLQSPIGKVHGGLFTSSKLAADLVQRIPLPTEQNWPRSLFDLKRNLLEMRIAYKGKELIIVNVHNSAFDKGDIRQKQMEFIGKRYIEEYSKGNYVILGGDFNMVFPNTEILGSYLKVNPIQMDNSLFPSNWNFVSDNKNLTNRDGAVAFNPSLSGMASIDGFILSPNVRLIESKVHNLGFEFSDHEPMEIKVVLNWKMEGFLWEIFYFLFY